jgi:hypothetical protein
MSTQEPYELVLSVQMQHPRLPHQRERLLLQERTAAAARFRSEVAVRACAIVVCPQYNTNPKFPVDTTTQGARPSARDVTSVSAEQVQVVRGKLEAETREGEARIDRVAQTATRLAESGRQVHASAADANSQFDSVARLVAYAALLEHPLSRQAPTAAHTLREKVTVWLQEHRAELTSGLNRKNGLAAAPGYETTDVTELGGEEYTKWCRRFRDHHCWGDQYSLQALAEVLGLDIYVWSTRGALYDLSVSPGCSTTGPTDSYPRGGGGRARHRVPTELLELPGGVYYPVVNTHILHL